MGLAKPPVGERAAAGARCERPSDWPADGTDSPRQPYNLRVLEPEGEPLTLEDVEFLLEGLPYTRHKFETYPYDSEELRSEQLARVDAVIVKLRRLRQAMRG
jgi:hypothetical protein